MDLPRTHTPLRHHTDFGGYNDRRGKETRSKHGGIYTTEYDRGGSLLLNIGPTADGRIPVVMQQRLYDIGSWLKVNGEAIYNTRAWDNAPPVTAETTLYFTRNGKNLYAICTKFPEGGIIIPNIKKASSVSMLGLNGKIHHSTSGNNLKITAPTFVPGKIPCEHAWVFKIENAL